MCLAGVCPRSRVEEGSALTPLPTPTKTTQNTRTHTQAAPPRFAAFRPPARALGPPATAAARSLYIQTQETPNPASLMFLPGQSVLGVAVADGASTSSSAGPAPPASANFSSAREAAAASPLAAALFRVDGVTGVFLGSDFMTVTKAEGAAWAEVKPGVFAAITEHYASGLPALRPRSPGSAAGGGGGVGGGRAPPPPSTRTPPTRTTRRRWP